MTISTRTKKTSATKKASVAKSKKSDKASRIHKNIVLFDYAKKRCTFSKTDYISIKQSVSFTKAQIIKMLFSTDTKQESKKAYNVNVLAVLELNNRKICSTQFDTYYRIIREVYESVLNDKEQKTYKKKLAEFSIRNSK